MTGHFVYPRLDAGAALELQTALAAGSPPADETLVSTTHHPRAVPAASGGTPVTADRLQGVRTAVHQALQQEDVRTDADFDRVVGRTLFEEMDIVPGDAARQDVWNYIGLVFLPQTASRRFSFDQTARWVGNRRRHVLRRLWFRRKALGDLLDSTARPLDEDEQVQLTERQMFASDARLARMTAGLVLSYPGRARGRRFTREFVKSVQAASGTTILGILSDEELNDLLAHLYAKTLAAVGT